MVWHFNIWPTVVWCFNIDIRNSFYHCQLCLRQYFGKWLKISWSESSQFTILYPKAPEEFFPLTELVTRLECITWSFTFKMAKPNIDMGSLNGPLSEVAGLNTHKMAISRDYISQPRLSKYACMLSYSLFCLQIKVSDCCLRHWDGFRNRCQ